jgi:hypothetical protein
MGAMNGCEVVQLHFASEQFVQVGLSWIVLLIDIRNFEHVIGMGSDETMEGVGVFVELGGSGGELLIHLFEFGDVVGGHVILSEGEFEEMAGVVIDRTNHTATLVEAVSKAEEYLTGF